MFRSYYSGFADEAGASLDIQLHVTRALGWSNIEMRNVEVPGFPGGNLHDIPDDAFEKLAATLSEAGVRVNSLGSSITNASKSIRDPFDGCRAAAERGAQRARKLGTEYIRVMSYAVGDVHDLMEEERFRRLREVVRIFADSGATVVHENCSCYGAMSVNHSIRLLEEVPGLKLVFDMGNCGGDPDFSKPEVDGIRPRVNAWEFYQGVREHIAYVHIKDVIWDPVKQAKIHTFPGEGACYVKEIIADLLAAGYTGPLSIEPHMHAGLPASLGLTDAENRQQTYIEYGQRLQRIVESVSSASAAR
jgi:sugar phosphate isomerase/epimerase